MMLPGAVIYSCRQLPNGGHRASATPNEAHRAARFRRRPVAAAAPPPDRADRRGRPRARGLDRRTADRDDHQVTRRAGRAVRSAGPDPAERAGDPPGDYRHGAGAGAGQAPARGRAAIRGEYRRGERRAVGGDEDLRPARQLRAARPGHRGGRRPAAVRLRRTRSRLPEPRARRHRHRRRPAPGGPGIPRLLGRRGHQRRVRPGHRRRGRGLLHRAGVFRADGPRHQRGQRSRPEDQRRARREASSAADGPALRDHVRARGSRRAWSRWPGRSAAWRAARW